MEINELLKKTRTERKISQKELAHNITTRESISKYESGKNNIPFVVLLKLLEKLNLSIDEFVFYLDTDSVRSKNKGLKSWLKIKEKTKTKHLLLEELKIKIQETEDIAAIRNYLIFQIHDWYALPEKERKLDKKDQEYLQLFMNYLESIHEWGRFEMTSFSSMLFLFNTSYIEQRLQEIHRKIETHRDFEIFHPILFGLYNNAFLLMLERKNLTLAEKYLKKFQTTYHHSLFSHHSSVNANFYQALLAYLTKRPASKKQILNIFEGLKLLGAEEARKEFMLDLRKYEAIYGIPPLLLEEK